MKFIWIRFSLIQKAKWSHNFWPQNWKIRPQCRSQRLLEIAAYETTRSYSARRPVGRIAAAKCQNIHTAEPGVADPEGTEGQVPLHILTGVSEAKPCTFQMDFLFGFLLLPTQIFGTSAGPGTPRVRAPPLPFQKEWEEYKNLPHSNLKTSVVNPTSWEQVGGKRIHFVIFVKKIGKKYVCTVNSFLVSPLSWT